MGLFHDEFFGLVPETPGPHEPVSTSPVRKRKAPCKRLWLFLAMVFAEKQCGRSGAYGLYAGFLN